MTERCGYNECVPDITGICKVCGHEVLTETDSDGTPLPDPDSVGIPTHG